MLTGRTGDIAAKIAFGIFCYFVLLLAISVVGSSLQAFGR